jgi:hypothetical protein
MFLETRDKVLLDVLSLAYASVLSVLPAVLNKSQVSGLFIHKHGVVLGSHISALSAHSKVTCVSTPHILLLTESGLLGPCCELYIHRAPQFRYHSNMLHNSGCQLAVPATVQCHLCITKHCWHSRSASSVLDDDSDMISV